MLLNFGAFVPIDPNFKGFYVGIKPKKATVCDYPDGRFEIRHKGVSLPYSKFDKVRQVKHAQVVNNKRLGAVLPLAKHKQEERSFKPSQIAPQRRGQDNSMFHEGICTSGYCPFEKFNVYVINDEIAIKQSLTVTMLIEFHSKLVAVDQNGNQNGL